MGIVPQSLRKHFSRYLRDNSDDDDATFASVEARESFTDPSGTVHTEGIGGGGGGDVDMAVLTAAIVGDGSTNSIEVDLTEFSAYNGDRAIISTDLRALDGSLLEDASVEFFPDSPNLLTVRRPDNWPDGVPVSLDVTVASGEGVSSGGASFGPGSDGGVS